MEQSELANLVNSYFLPGPISARWASLTALNGTDRWKRHPGVDARNYEVHEAFLQAAIDAGVLSIEEEGNYGVYTRWHKLCTPQLPMGPPLFFTHERDARAYAHTRETSDKHFYVKQVSDSSLVR